MKKSERNSFGFDTAGLGITMKKILPNERVRIMFLQNVSGVDKRYNLSNNNKKKKQKELQEQYCQKVLSR